MAAFSLPVWKKIAIYTGCFRSQRWMFGILNPRRFHGSILRGEGGQEENSRFVSRQRNVNEELRDGNTVAGEVK